MGVGESSRQRVRLQYEIMKAGLGDSSPVGNSTVEHGAFTGRVATLGSQRQAQTRLMAADMGRRGEEETHTRTTSKGTIYRGPPSNMVKLRKKPISEGRGVSF